MDRLKAKHDRGHHKLEPQDIGLPDEKVDRAHNARHQENDGDDDVVGSLGQVALLGEEESEQLAEDEDDEQSHVKDEVATGIGQN